MALNRSVEVSVRLLVWDIYRFQVRTLLERFWFVLVIPALMLGLAVFLFVAMWFSRNQAAAHAAQTTQVLVNALPLVAVFSFIYLVVPYFSAVAASKNPNLYGNTSYTLSPAGVSVRGPHGEAELRWSAFVKARELKWAFLLYPQKNIAHVIPKRGFQSQADVLECRDLLRQNISKFKSRK
jgi:ABC-type proline/glycine betaine transport system permease subunit